MLVAGNIVIDNLPDKIGCFQSELSNCVNVVATSAV